MDFEGGIRHDLFIIVLPGPSQAQNYSILFILVGLFPGLFVRVAVVVAVVVLCYRWIIANRVFLKLGDF